MIWSTITSAVSSFVSSVASIGRAIGTSVAKVAGKIGEAIEAGAAWLGKVNGIYAAAFMQQAGVLRPGERADDFAERALQAKAHGITLENSRDFDAYMERLRGFPVDADLAAKRPPGERAAALTGLATVALEAKIGAPKDSLASVWLMPVVDPKLFTPDRVYDLLADGQTRQSLLRSLEGKLSPDESLDLARRIIERDGGRGDPNPLSASDLPMVRERLSELRNEHRQWSADGPIDAAQLERMRNRHEGA